MFGYHSNHLFLRKASTFWNHFTLIDQQLIYKFNNHITFSYIQNKVGLSAVYIRNTHTTSSKFISGSKINNPDTKENTIEQSNTEKKPYLASNHKFVAYRRHIFKNSLLAFPAPSDNASSIRKAKIMSGNMINKSNATETAIPAIDPKKIDGKLVSDLVKKNITEEIKAINLKLSEEGKPSFKPHLSIIQVGNKSDSSIYVKTKLASCEKVGIATSFIKYDDQITQEELLNKIKELNEDNDIDAILVQLPLPSHLDENLITDFIDPKKDVDGFHSMNIGLLAKRNHEPFFEPCTPRGIIRLLSNYNISLVGKHAVVIGRSNIVGMPIGHLLMDNDCTVTICHSKTINLPDLVKQADILVVAIGDPQYIKADWIKPGAVVIDVGMNSIDDSTRKSGYRLVGDVEKSAKEVASMITPVPGGVGPMTVAMLLENTLISAKIQKL